MVYATYLVHTYNFFLLNLLPPACIVGLIAFCLPIQSTPRLFEQSTRLLFQQLQQKKGLFLSSSCPSFFFGFILIRLFLQAKLKLNQWRHVLISHPILAPLLPSSKLYIKTWQTAEQRWPVHSQGGLFSYFHITFLLSSNQPLQST